MAVLAGPSILLVGIVTWLAVLVVVVGLLYAFGEQRPREQVSNDQKRSLR